MNRWFGDLLKCLLMSKEEKLLLIYIGIGPLINANGKWIAAKSIKIWFAFFIWSKGDFSLPAIEIQAYV